MANFRIYLESLEITNLFGISLGNCVEPGDVICLDGDLGSGKTTLTQAIARGVEVPQEYYVTSPSFNIFHEYPGRIPLYHMDLYRLHSSDDVVEIGLDEYFYLDGLAVIEWSEKALDILPENRLSIKIQIVTDNARRLDCFYEHHSWRHRLEIIAQKLSSNQG